MIKFKTVKHKYGAKKCERNGIKFPSKLERQVYDYLVYLQNQGKILFFLRQIPIDLPGNAKHLVDFFVFKPEEAFFIEVKGKDLPMGKLKRQQASELLGVDIHVAQSNVDVDKILFQESGCDKL